MTTTCLKYSLWIHLRLFLLATTSCTINEERGEDRISGVPDKSSDSLLFKCEISSLNSRSFKVMEAYLDYSSFSQLRKDELIPQKLPVSLNSKKLLPKNLLATPVAGAGDDRASSTMGGSDLGLWQGYEVKYEFIGLLDCIAKKYPETFDCFTTKSKELCTLKLNMLCATVKTFTNTSITKIDAEMFAEYRALFSDLQRSFNVNCLVDRLNYVEQLQFSQPLLDKFHAVDSFIGDAKSKLQDLHAV